MVDPASISNEELMRVVAQSRPVSVCILRPGPRRHDADAEGLILEHGRRNVALRAQGTLAIVIPIAGNPEVAGVGVFGADAETVRALMAQDPAVAAGVLTATIYEGRSFPGDTVPGHAVSP
jgi:hypothetical protein